MTKTFRTLQGRGEKIGTEDERGGRREEGEVGGGIGSGERRGGEGEEGEGGEGGRGGRGEGG
jgi:hypothetical protein